MAKFTVENLDDRTKIMHNAQTRWRTRNWRESLGNHSAQIEELLELVELLNVWKRRLPRRKAVSQLRKEIVADAYGSIQLACFGFYKYAYMSLRSQFETSARLIYFSSHPLEFELWQGGNEEWMKLIQGGDVWGPAWNYFTYMFPEIEQLNKHSDIKTKKLQLTTSGNESKLQNTYSKLSKFAHSVGPALQTRYGRLSPKYDQTEFAEWIKLFKAVQMYVNILFVLCFVEDFKKIPTNERNQIFDLAIGADYKDPIKSVCGL